ncbi:High-affinity nickel transport protein [Choanephora cucurbitarum]|uniref:Nickel/cobalt efflux system n=1 Tax=Choanephora cucurbitarum TaxID=101091 RepID=A0A1C7NJR7_9FUNG|nr:High-affinity nickel transport protein [Choanephora cucurbitarum]
MSDSTGVLSRFALKFMSENSFGYKMFFGPDPHKVRFKVLLLLLGLSILQVVVWVIAVILFKPYPSMMGTGALAYTLGLRHAVDADHISAIDNVTRKLLNNNQHPVCVGLFFSLGHSTVVFITSIIVAATANAVANSIDHFSEIGGLIGTSVSIAFLVLIAILNLICMIGVIKTMRQVKKEGVYTEIDIEEFLSNRGILGRFFRPVFRFVNASWKMYPLGFLFGLGFDTASEVTLLGITAVQGANGMSMWLIILLPILFASGMALIDSLDSMLMLFTYTWAYVNPVRKLFYNLTITSISVVVAVIVALIELFSLIGEQLELDNGWWQFWYFLSDSFEWIGIIIVGAFIVTWFVSAVVYRLAGYRDLEREFDDYTPEKITTAVKNNNEIEEKV